MLGKTELAYLARSGSWRFMKDAQPRAGTDHGDGGGYGRLNWNGHPVFYRPGTSDCLVIYEVLLRPGAKAEYAVPESLTPRTILDIGGNIGAAALYFARRFPNATIHTFEPVPENMALLKKNVAPYKQIVPHHLALGSTDGELTMFGSDSDRNHGGFSFYDKGVDTGRTRSVTMRQAQAYLDEQGISTPDIIKIDTEGAEYSILMTLRPEVLSRVQWITGELHGERDFDLLGHLGQWFDIGMNKSVGSRLFTFSARNLALSPATAH